MSKYLLSIAIFTLSVSIFYAGFQLSNLEDKENPVSNTELGTEKGLWTIEETANYLGLSVERLNDVLKKQTMERGSSWTHYQYIPYITIHNQRYFNKAQVDEWIKYSSNLYQNY